MKLGEIASALGEKCTNGADLDITGCAPLAMATADKISFVVDINMGKDISSSNAGALILPTGVEPDRPSIIADNPIMVFAKALELLHPPPPFLAGIDASSVVSENVTIGENVSIGPFVSVGENSSIGDGVSIMAGAQIGQGCVIGPDSVIFPNVALYDNSKIGARCRIHANSTIGSDGFGYTKTISGEYYKIPQTGSVTIEDDVEIGSNTSIDRATMGETLIKKGAKLDNQVQIGHNSVIGENVVIAGCSGVAGSVTIGANVMIGGAVAITDHITIADGVIIAGKSGVHTSITEPGIYGGPLAMKFIEFKKFMLSGKRLDKLTRRIKEIEKNISERSDH